MSTTNHADTRAYLTNLLTKKIADLRGKLSISSMCSHPWRVATADGTVLKMEKDGTTRFGFDDLAGYACFTSKKDAQKLADAWNSKVAGHGMEVAPMTERATWTARLADAERSLAALADLAA